MTDTPRSLKDLIADAEDMVQAVSRSADCAATVLDDLSRKLDARVDAALGTGEGRK